MTTTEKTTPQAPAPATAISQLQALVDKMNTLKDNISTRAATIETNLVQLTKNPTISDDAKQLLKEIDQMMLGIKVYLREF